MFLKKVDGPRAVRIGNGRVISLADLPPANTTRWVASRKEVVVQAVRCGLISREAAIERYELSEEELDAWCKQLEKFGKSGLKTTKLQVARQPWVE